MHTCFARIERVDPRTVGPLGELTATSLRDALVRGTSGTAVEHIHATRRSHGWDIVLFVDAADPGEAHRRADAAVVRALGSELALYGLVVLETG